ncbi:MAG TPA: flagellar type III secretion system protein FliR [candidate division Zixibacteria bacterium]|nr:flagellar type III secretion system protein FliR [candidate division Zixibacteria bacterium]
MLEFLTYSADKLQTLLLISFRAGGLFITAPILGHHSIPMTVKAGFAVVLAIVLIPFAAQTAPPAVESIWLLGLLAAKELLVGLIIGFFFSLLFSGVRMGGAIVGFQQGLLMANVLDPEAGSQVSIVAEFWIVIASLIFIAIDGHHAIISALADSYQLIPVGATSFSGPAGEMIIRFSAYAFTMAVKISAPIVITLFLVSVALGVVARTVPQMNIFIVGMPLKIGVGFLVMAIALPLFKNIVNQTLYYLDNEVLAVLAGMSTV